MGLLIPLVVVLLALVAWYGSMEDGQVVVSRGVTLFLTLLVLMGWGLYAHEVYVKDKRFEELFSITTSVATVAESCRVGVDSALQTLRDFEKIWPDTIR